MRFLLQGALCLLLALPLPSRAQTSTSSDLAFDDAAAASLRAQLNGLADQDYEKKVHLGSDGSLPYRLLRPSGAAAERGYPLVVTLHNSARIGQDNEKQLEPLARIWLRAEIRRKYPAYVIAPQFAARSSTYAEDPQRKVLGSVPSADVARMLPLIDEVLKAHPDIDRRRIYLVGYSMGASTAQNLMSRAPERFAALVSIAAVPDFSNLRALAAKPIWLIHGGKDVDNPYPGSVALYQALQGDRRLVFTTYASLDHNAITLPFLLSEDIPAWLFEQTL